MKLSRRSAIFAVSGTLPYLAFNRAAYAGTVVKVSLWDKGETSMEGIDTLMPMGLAMPGAKMDMASMGITVDILEIAAGEVTFKVVNESKDFYHSLVISPVEDLSSALPYIVDQKMVDEDAAGRTAKVKELRPHDSGAVTVDLKPGKYILYCNIAGHYVMGMWTMVTVTE